MQGGLAQPKGSHFSEWMEEEAVLEMEGRTTRPPPSLPCGGAPLRCWLLCNHGR